MFKNVLQKVFGASQDREVRRLQPMVDEVNAQARAFAAMSNEDLRGQTAAFKEQIAERVRDVRRDLAEARLAWQEERDEDARVPAQLHVEQLERELRAAEARALDEILPQAFAAVREAATRTIGLRHYDVQIIGGMVLHYGKIAEMKTGEGKTLVATLPLYLNALLGEGCHLITVNDYLARRDGGWMGRIYHLLGLSVGLVVNSFSAVYDPDYVVPGTGQEDERLVHWRPVARRDAYLADITYGTNNEFGFDYLRDNIARDISLTVQRKLNYAIVDEVDNILIDEARTPLIISGPAEEATDQYRRFAELVRRLRPNTAKEDMPPNGHFNIDLKTKSVTLTEMGIVKIEDMVEEVNVEAGESIYDPKHYEMTHYLDNAMRAEYAYHRDRDYVVQNREVLIVDPNTGRLMQGRRYSEGLHEAIEAKEGVEVQRETVTLATITIQNYFRMYRKLAGMTGTAATEQEEFHKIYNLDVVVIPTNVEYMADQAHELVEVSRKQDGAQVVEYRRKDRPGEPAYFKRVDYPDRIFAGWQTKYQAVVDEIREVLEAGRPVLVGTVSVESSELLSKELTRAGIKHTVLNAKLHEKEAHVVVQAGQPGVVTIATNMAGRGTDILLGGNPEGLAMQLVEERCFRVQDAARVARLVVEGQIEPARREAQTGNGLSPALVDSISALYTEFEEELQWDSMPGGIPWQVAVRKLQPQFGVDERTGRDLAALVQAGLSGRAQERVDALELRAEIIPWLIRFYTALAQYRMSSDRGEFLAELVYEDHYRVRAALTRAALNGDLPAAEAMARTTPALSPDLIPAIQNVKRKCEDDRQKIWAAGGLHIIGTERHEARRIDNQLRGRAARQGDPGSSQFFVSFDDDLMRRFGGERIQGLLERLGGDSDLELPASGTLSKTVENLQTKAESYNYDIRKHLLEFDNVVNKQREVIYSRRRSILEGARYDLEGEVRHLFLNILQQRIEQYTSGWGEWAGGEIEDAIIASSNPVTDEVNAPAVLQRLAGLFGIDQETMEDLADADSATLREELKAVAEEACDRGRPYELLAIELHNLLLFLPPLPSVEAIYGARNVAEQRETARSGYLAMLNQLLDRLQQALTEQDIPVNEAAFQEQRQNATEGVRKIFDIIGRERPSRDQLKQEQRVVERRLSDLAVHMVAGCLETMTSEQLQALAEALFEQKLAEAYIQLGYGNYAMLDAAEARAEDLKSLSELDLAMLRQNVADVIGAMDRKRLEALVEDLDQGLAEADGAVWGAFGRDPDVASLGESQVEQLATALFEDLSPEVRNALAALSAERLGVQAMREFTQAEMLGAIDTYWPQHLTAMDELREGIGLQAFAQRDPLVEFSRLSFGGFERFLIEIDRTVIDRFFQDLPRYQAVVAQHRESLRTQEQLALSGARLDDHGTVRRTGAIGRNDPCWCGSGKKYKVCHMRSDQAKAGAPASPAATPARAEPVGNGRSAQKGAPAAKGKAGRRK